MKQFHVRMTTQVTYSAIVYAESFEAANEIAQNLDPDDCFCEESCLYDHDLEEISDGQDYDIPQLIQTEHGYAIKKGE